MDKRIMVVYFSRDGSTLITAEAEARRLDAGLVEKAGGQVAGSLALPGASPGKTGDPAALTATGETWPVL